MSENFISVIIPTYNSDRFISEAIESVLQQTKKPDEIIVVDDGSTDDTQQTVEKFGGSIRYIYQENAGPAAARNRGLEAAKGDLIGFVDADDIWLKNKLELQLNLFQQNPVNEIVIGLLYRIPLAKTDEILQTEIEDGEYAASVGSALMKKSVFEKIGAFDEELRFSEDIDLFFRILEAGINVVGHEEVVQLYRRHDKNSTEDEKSSLYHLKAFKKSLNRRRKKGKSMAVSNKMNSIKEFWEAK